MFSRPLTPLLALGLLGLGCSNDGVTEAGVTHPTLIEVAPELFLGEVPCTEREGGLTRYVATLTDADSGFRLPSSRPVPCSTGVGFGFVVPGRRYTVRVDAYDTAVLAPRAAGSPLMVEAEPDAAPAAIATAPLRQPAWTAECEPAVAVYTTIVRPPSCSRLVATDAKPETPTELRLPLTPLLGELECGSEPGQVDRLVASLSLDDETRELEVPCAAAGEAVFTDVPARQSVSAFVSAFSADSTTPFAGASCQAFTIAGASIAASCTKLSQVGTLRVDLATALEELGLSCDASISELSIDVPGEERPRRVVPPDCRQPWDLGASAGPAAVTVTVRSGEQELATLTCGAEVTPGSVTVAICEQNSSP